MRLILPYPVLNVSENSVSSIDHFQNEVNKRLCQIKLNLIRTVGIKWGKIGEPVKIILKEWKRNLIHQTQPFGFQDLNLGYIGYR